MVEIDRCPPRGYSRLRAHFALLTAAILLAGIFLTAAVWLQPQEVSCPALEPPVPAMALYTSRSPILIDGNDDFTAANGVVGGSGIESDPYIIDGWEIVATSADCIAIRNTDAYFVVRNCYVHDGGWAWKGIYLHNCTNGRLENNTCSYNYYGILLDSSSSNSIVNNTVCSNNWDGIFLYDSHSNSIVNNNCSDNYYGIELLSSHSNSIVNNTVCSNSIGIWLDSSSSNSIVNNIFCSNNEVGIWLDSSSSNSIVNNTVCSNKSDGISLYYSDSNSIVNNNCSNNWEGIYLCDSHSNSIVNNTVCSNIYYGIYLYDSDSNSIVNNNCSDNYYGIYIFGYYISYNNSISWNQLRNNELEGVYIEYGSNNVIWNNTFHHNNGAGDTYDPSHIQALDDGSSNWWNSTEGYGNYWSDWTTPDDVPPWGIVDNPYNISGSAEAKDYYPRTTEPVDDEAPIANAGSDQTVDEGTLVTFDGSGSTDNVGIVNYTWSFDDDGAVLLYGVGPSYTFNQPGIYTVTLNVTDAADNWNTDTVTITVLDVTDPVADAGPDQSVDEGALVTFDGSGSTDNVGIVNYTWTFVDQGVPVVRYGENVQYTFLQPGVYVVTLNVSDAKGNWDVDTVTITVLDATNPVANAGNDQTVTQGTLVTFDGSGSTDNVGIVNYTWTFTDDGVTKTLYGVSPTYKFDNPGTYEVALTVRDAAGNSATDTVTIKVEEESVAEMDYILLVGMGAVIVVVIVAAAYLMMRRGKGGKKISGGEADSGAGKEDVPPPPKG